MSDTVLSGLNSRFDRMVVFSGGCGGESFPSFFQLLKVTELLYSSVFTASEGGPVRHIITLTLVFLSPHLADFDSLFYLFLRGPHVPKQSRIICLLEICIPSSFLFAICLNIYIFTCSMEGIGISWSIHAYLSSLKPL